MTIISRSLGVPDAAGVGPTSDVSMIGPGRSLVHDGGFAGTITIEGSDTGAVFDSIVGAPLVEVPGIYSFSTTVRFVRLVRAGAVSGAPTVTLTGESNAGESAMAADVRLMRQLAEQQLLRALDDDRLSLQTRSRERVSMLYRNRGQR